MGRQIWLESESITDAHLFKRKSGIYSWLALRHRRLKVGSAECCWCLISTQIRTLIMCGERCCPDEGGCVSHFRWSCLLCAAGWIRGRPRARSRGENLWGHLLFPGILECSLEEDSEGYGEVSLASGTYWTPIWVQCLELMLWCNFWRWYSSA